MRMMHMNATCFTTLTKCTTHVKMDQSLPVTRSAAISIYKFRQMEYWQLIMEVS